MIAPNMAKMLAYIMTDFPFSLSDIQAITQEISSKSFNCVTVDGDTSTSDSFYLLSCAAKDFQKVSKQKTRLPPNLLKHHCLIKTSTNIACK